MTLKEMECPQAEKDTILGSREQGLIVVTCLRRYRQAAKKVLDLRYSNGECDASALHYFGEECNEIEEFLREENDAEEI